ncbi:PTS cellbiose transporter subunit IIC, partial [Firmicutes bacterium AM59-13]
MVCSEAISLCYRPAPKDAGFHFVQATTPLTRRRPSKG